MKLYRNVVLDFLGPAMALSLVLTCGSNTAYSQQAGDAKTAKLEIPDGPLLEPLPDFCQWVITFYYPEDKQKKSADEPSKPMPAYLAARPRKCVTTKTGNLIREEMVDLNGRQSERWSTGQTQYTKPAGQTVWFQSHGDVDPGVAGRDVNLSPLPANGFRNLDFIAAKNYAGTVPYGDMNCLLFVADGSPVPDLTSSRKQSIDADSRSTIAYIDAKTRLPVILRLGGETRTYQFMAPPSAMLTLPADLTEQIKKGLEARTRIFAPAAKPY